MIKKIAIMTAGGDCCGLNAAIRTIVKICNTKGIEVIGIVNGYKGFIEGTYIRLTANEVENIGLMGGTILGSSNKECPFKYLVNKDTNEYADLTDVGIKQLQKIGINDIIIIGGDGTLDSARVINERGMNVIGIPKTIDNDMGATDVTIGFDTAVSNVVDAIEKIKTTANSHNRVMVAEIMGRTAGFLTLYSGIASSADIILIPEIDYDLDKICDKVSFLMSNGKRSVIIAMAEAAKEIGQEAVVGQVVKDSFEQLRYGGAADKLAKEIESKTGHEAKSVVFGHIQRGGNTTANDMILATKTAGKAIKLLLNNESGIIVGKNGNDIVTMKFPNVRIPRILEPNNNDLIEIGRTMGIFFGK